MSPEQYQAYVAQGYTHVPVIREVLADLETPLGTYLKLADAPHSYFLESVQGGEKWGRYSIIGLPCHRRLSVRDREVTLLSGDTVERVEQVEDPLAFVQSFRAGFRVPDLPGLPRFHGGLVGYFGYDIVRYIEKRLDRAGKLDPLGTPDILLMVSQDVVVFDNLRGTLSIICHAETAQADGLAAAHARLDAIEARLRSPLQAPVIGKGEDVSETDFRSGFGQEAFEAAVGHVKEYVASGDIMQVVLSQRMSLPFAHSPMSLYRALRSLNPSPYLYFFNMGDFHIVGSSPEILARLEKGTVTVRPIAGTRPRGRTPEEDVALEKDLLADPKEIAEHLMLIDLGRNDAGRIATTGSVRVTDRMVIERYSHVMHIVSNVEATLLPGKDAIDVLRAVFPAGTLSGAPKIRAMEIIEDLEPVKRGIYGGAVGYLDWSGDMDTAIAIRTAVLKDGQLHIQAGAGVVADSVPASEWQETCNKARAIVRAAAMAANGLVPVRN